MRRISRRPSAGPTRLQVEAQTASGHAVERTADIVLVVTGVRPDTMAGAHLTASIRTGMECRYQPAPGGPDRWPT